MWMWASFNCMLLLGSSAIRWGQLEPDNIITMECSPQLVRGWKFRTLDSNFIALSLLALFKGEGQGERGGGVEGWPVGAGFSLLNIKLILLNYVKYFIRPRVYPIRGQKANEFEERSPGLCVWVYVYVFVRGGWKVQSLGGIHFWCGPWSLLAFLAALL